MPQKLKITWIRSGIQAKTPHCRTIHALGLHRLHQTVVKNDTPAVRGMVDSVRYMLKVEEVAG